MTLPATGTIPWSDFRAELRAPAAPSPIVFPDARTLWLAEKVSGPLVLPNDYHGKAAIKIVHQATVASNQNPTYTFNSVNFGPEYSGRTLIVIAHLQSTINAILDQTAVNIGGSAAVGSDVGETGGNPARGSAGVGIWAAQPSGTSGTVTVTYSDGGFPSNPANGCTITVLSVAGISTTPHDTALGNGGGSGGSSDSIALDVPANGVLIAAVTRANSTAAFTFTNVDERSDTVFDTTGRVGVAFSNRLSVQGNRSVSFSSTGTVSFGFMAKSYG